MKSADINWTDENLDKFLAEPASFVAGNKMLF
jgi:cytochrome c2